MSNFEMIVEINTDAGSLETINSIIDEILPLNIYFEFALQRNHHKIQIGRFDLYGI